MNIRSIWRSAFFENACVTYLVHFEMGERKRKKKREEILNHYKIKILNFEK